MQSPPLLLLSASASALLLPSAPLPHATVAAPRSPPPRCAKGFGKPVNPPPPPPRPPSEAAKRRDKAAADFDKLKSTGAPEYTVCVRTVSATQNSDWMSVGAIAVPRSSSEDQAVSMAIFNHEDALLKGAYKAYPRLKMSTDKFEYGYRLQDFPDDAMRIARKELVEKAEKANSNPLMQWFSQLDSPLNKD